jgi:hypothetical protein
VSRYDKPEFTLRIPAQRVEPIDDDLTALVSVA